MSHYPTSAEGPLSRREKTALATEILAAYARARWLLRRRGLRGALAELRRDGRAVPGDPSEAARRLMGVRLARAVIRTLVILPADSRCLMQSLVLTSLLARRGVASSLVIAVLPAEKFGAHAWVEHGGRPLLPTGQTRTGSSSFQRLVEV